MGYPEDTGIAIDQGRRASGATEVEAPPRALLTHWLRCPNCGFEAPRDQFIDGMSYSIFYSPEPDCPVCGVTIYAQPMLRATTYRRELHEVEAVCADCRCWIQHGARVIRFLSWSNYEPCLYGGNPREFVMRLPDDDPRPLGRHVSGAEHGGIPAWYASLEIGVWNEVVYACQECNQNTKQEGAQTT